jgi:lipoprotein-anchoring transpeptidase ErfK/SrfK
MRARLQRRLGAAVHILLGRRLEQRIAAREPVVIAVSRRAGCLRLYSGGRVVRTYRVGVGAGRTPTPAGRFRIENKLVDPVWHVPDVPERYGELAGGTLPAGDESNRIKARWLGVCAEIGIHGTDSNGSGPGVSYGCVVMSVPDVIELYDRAPEGAPVLIR